MVYATIEARPAPGAERSGHHSLYMNCGSMGLLTREIARSFAHDIWVAEVGLHHRVGSLPSQYDPTYTRILSNIVRLVAEISRLNAQRAIPSGDDRSVQVAQTIWRYMFEGQCDLQIRFLRICVRLQQNARDSRDDDHTVFAEVGQALRQAASLPPRP